MLIIYNLHLRKVPISSYRLYSNAEYKSQSQLTKPYFTRNCSLGSDEESVAKRSDNLSS